MKTTFKILTLIALISVISSCKNKNNTDVKETKTEIKATFEFEKEATFTGTLQNLEYENFAGEKLSTYVLELENLVNIDSKNPDIKPLKSIQEVQIGFSDDVKDASKYLNKKITVIGTIYPEQTVNDRRPVIMINATIKK